MDRRHATRPYYQRSMREAKAIGFAGLIGATMLIGMMIGASMVYGIMADTCQVEEHQQ